jgi:hypothetical protein
MHRVATASCRATLAFVLFATIALTSSTAPGHGQTVETEIVPGGFLESATTGLARPLLTQSVIQALLPARGPFNFPAPYGTRGVRLTNATDCGGGDCVFPVGYSYWRNTNNHVGSDEMLIFLGLNNTRGGGGPTLFGYNKTTEQVTRLGPLFDPSSGRNSHSGEGWYFSATQPTKIYMDDGPRMLRYDVLSRQYETVYDVSARYGADKILWQMHSSDDDRVHSATLRATPGYEMLGCVVYHEDTAQFQYFPKIGDFDECQLDKSGRWLLILENVDHQYDMENRIIDLTTGVERLIWDQDGAVAHDDTGYGYVVGPDNWYAVPNAEFLWDFSLNPLSRVMMSHTIAWDSPAPNHLSHTNARPGVPPSQQYACGSGASRAIVPWANEIICFALDGSMRVLVVAPVMTDLNASGGGDDYSKQPKGNLDVTGQYFIWTSNAGGGRLDAFIVKVPSQVLMGDTGGTADTTPPVLSAVTASGIATSAATIAWTTSEAADSQVEYGTTTSYGSQTPRDTTLLTGHSQGLSGLTAGTLYHYRVRSRDAAGNLATSQDFTFTTTAEPVPPPPAGTGPIAHWPLSEGSGTMAADATGRGHTGTLLNGATWVTWTAGTGINLDGANDYVDVPHAADLDPYPLTLTTWVRSGTTGLGGVVNKYAPSSFNGYQLFFDGGSLCAWYFRDASNFVWNGTGCSLATSGVNDNLWHHVAFVVDAAGGRLYVDGVLRASRAWTGTPGATTTTQRLALGAYPGTDTPYLRGQLDDVRIYARPLTAQEVTAVAAAPDTTAPAVGLAAPSAGATVSGTVTMSATASDNVGVTGVRLRVDGVDLGAEITASPYSRSWNTTTAVNGTHVLTAVARDAAGNTTVSAPITVTVANDAAAPAISAVAATGVTGTTATIGWTTDEPADSQVEYGTTTAYGGQTARDATLTTSHSQTLTGLAAGTLYHFRVKSRDAAGNLATSQDFTFTTTATAPGGDGGKRRPVGRWKFSEGVGTTAADVSGLGHAGALMNGATWATGTAGTGINLDGANDYVDVPHAADLDPYPLTLTTWVRSGTTGLGGVVNKYAPSSFNGYQLFFDGGSLCAWYFRDASNFVWNGTGCSLATSGVNDNLWHHVAFVVDAAGGRLYVDGVLRASRAWTGTPGATTTTQRLALGAYPGTDTPYLRGQLDDVRIYARPLTEEEIFDAWDAAAPNP